MKTRLSGFVFAFLPAAAFGQQAAGPYVSLGAGLNLQQNLQLNEISQPPVTRADGSHLTFHPGFSGQVSLGYGLGNGFRAEIEGDVLDNVVRGVGGTTVPRRAGGVEEKLGGLANVLYDVDVGLPIHPYLGAGVGVQNADHENFNKGAIGSIVPGKGSESESGFAYQGIAGFSVPVSFVAGLSLTVDYRFLGLGPLGGYRGIHYTREYPAGRPAFTHFTNDFNHAVLIGFRYALFAPPPPPPPGAPAPVTSSPAAQEARTYLVFFDWDRSDLTARARQIVAEAAAASMHVQTTRIDVNGYTDLSGTPAYNQKLSVRRAEAVQAELVKDGVAKTLIDIHGYGESNPLVPTAPGVREPQNRRVEIILR